MKIVISKKVWGAFVQRMKNHWPSEHVEAIWGTETIDSFRITAFKRMKYGVKGTNIEPEITYDDIEVKRQKWLAEKAGFSFLGTIHSHPHPKHDATPTEDDHISAVGDGERIMGIMHLWKKKDRKRFIMNVLWWFPQPPFELEILPD